MSTNEPEGKRLMSVTTTEEELRENLHRKTETANVRVFQDADGYEIIEQHFTDGTCVLMHAAQYYALCREAARLSREKGLMFE